VLAEASIPILLALRPDALAHDLERGRESGRFLERSGTEVDHEAPRPLLRVLGDVLTNQVGTHDPCVVGVVAGEEDLGLGAGEHEACADGDRALEGPAAVRRQPGGGRRVRSLRTQSWSDRLHLAPVEQDGG